MANPPEWLAGIATDMPMAPIALFVCCRPSYTSASWRASPPIGFGRVRAHRFSDGQGPTDAPELLERIAEVRRLARERPRCGRVQVVEAGTHKGMAASIIDGVTDVLARAGRVIVFKGDLCCAPGLLEFMNSAKVDRRRGGHAGTPRPSCRTSSRCTRGRSLVLSIGMDRPRCIRLGAVIPVHQQGAPAPHRRERVLPRGSAL